MAGKIYAKDYGVAVRVSTGINLTGSTARTIKVNKPNGQESSWTATAATAHTGSISIRLDASARTFTRVSGSYLTDGFAVGDTITTTGFVNSGNNTTKIIETVTDTVIKVTVGTGLVTENGTGSIVSSTPLNDSGDITYTTVLNDLNVAGTYKIQAEITFASSKFLGETTSFRVYNKWE
jgi:Tfp pilus assembly protein FimT